MDVLELSIRPVELLIAMTLMITVTGKAVEKAIINFIARIP
jgi:hypothetical protein